MQLTMLRSTIQKDIIWFVMPAHMSFCHILGTKILIIITQNNFSSFRLRDNNLRFKDNSLRHRVNSSKYKALTHIQGQPRQQIAGMNADELADEYKKAKQQRDQQKSVGAKKKGMKENKLSYIGTVLSSDTIGTKV